MEKLKYEIPLLVNLGDKMSCSGTPSCVSGIDIIDTPPYGCNVGSCAHYAGCQNGTAAGECWSGTGACDSYYWSCCEVGIAVSGSCSTGSSKSPSSQCICKSGARAGLCCSSGTTVMWMDGCKSGT
jgi:hypothetical protein